MIRPSTQVGSYVATDLVLVDHAPIASTPDRRRYRQAPARDGHPRPPEGNNKDKCLLVL